MWERIRGVVWACLLFVAWFPGTVVDASSLTEFRWEKRLIVTFMQADSKDYRWLKQWTQANNCRLSERDLIVFVVTNQSAEQLSPQLTTANDVKQPHASSDPRQMPMLDAASVTHLRQQRRFPLAATEVFLIGKDGGIKSQSQEINQIDGLFNLIDAMPMRRQEASRQSGAC